LIEIVKELETFSVVSVDKAQTIVSIVGNEIAAHADTLKKVFDSLSNIDVRMVSYGGSVHNISILVNADQKKQVLQQLNSGLFRLN
jgi:aspartate kinase